MFKGGTSILALIIGGTLISAQLNMFDAVMGQVQHIQSIMDWGVQQATNYGPMMGL